MQTQSEFLSGESLQTAPRTPDPSSRRGVGTGPPAVPVVPIRATAELTNFKTQPSVRTSLLTAATRPGKKPLLSQQRGSFNKAFHDTKNRNQ